MHKGYFHKYSLQIFYSTDVHQFAMMLEFKRHKFWVFMKNSKRICELTDRIAYHTGRRDRFSLMIRREGRNDLIDVMEKSSDEIIKCKNEIKQILNPKYGTGTNIQKMQ